MAKTTKPYSKHIQGGFGLKHEQAAVLYIFFPIYTINIASTIEFLII